MKKKNKTNRMLRYGAASVLAVAAVGVGIMGLRAFKESRATAPTLSAEEKVLSASVTPGTLVESVNSYGVLAGEESESISLATGILVKEYLVQDGDHVEAGDPIALVDTASVKNTIAELQGVLDRLDEELAVAETLTLESKVTSSVAGRVKELYVSSGSSVSAAMAEKGALILLSLDGKMAVDVPADASLPVGQAVKVRTSEGKDYSGKVEARDKDEITVTITDKGPKNGDTAKVLTTDGKEIGEGTLYIHNQQAITGYSGTVSTVKVSKEQEISAGATLFTLTNTEYTARVDALIAQRSELEKEIRQLFQICLSGEVCAETSGMVGHRNEDMMKLSVMMTPARFMSLSMELPANTAALPQTETGAAPGPEEPEIPAEAPETGEAESSEEHPGTEETETPEEHPGMDESGEAPTDPSEEDGLREVEALLQKVEGRILTVMVSGQEATLEIPENVPVFEEKKDGKHLRIEDLQPGDLLLCTFDAKQTLRRIVRKQVENESESSEERPGEGNHSGWGGFRPSGGSRSGSSNRSEQEVLEEAARASVREAYSLPESVLCTVTPDDRMLLVMQVDELDISKLYTGQEVRVTLDALEGREFIGTVEQIDTEGTSDGGNARYPVTVAIPRSEQMLVGMNAAAVIELKREEGIALIPAAALQEDGNRVFLYTEYDEKNDALGGEVEVTTGRADGTNVEILSGMSEGETFYYRYAESLILG